MGCLIVYFEPVILIMPFKWPKSGQKTPNFDVQIIVFESSTGVYWREYRKGIFTEHKRKKETP